MAKRFGVAIIGGSGYGAGEAIRLLTMHPDIEVSSVISRSHVGKPIASVHSHLAGVSTISFEETVNLEALSIAHKSRMLKAGSARTSKKQ